MTLGNHREGSGDSGAEAATQAARAAFQSAADLAGTMARDLAEQVGALSEEVLRTLEGGGKLMFCGNGGSAADAQHLAAEYVVRFRENRIALAAIALTTDTSVLTAGGNDLGFDTIFSRQVEALGRRGDLLVLHSTSGNSENLIQAAAVAQRIGVRTVGILARDGGRLLPLVDRALVVPTEVTARAQEMHLAIGHIVCDWVDARFVDGSAALPGGAGK
jgi:D-sedoheptulose 7-phosphate isomerase